MDNFEQLVLCCNVKASMFKNQMLDMIIHVHYWCGGSILFMVKVVQICTLLDHHSFSFGLHALGSMQAGSGQKVSLLQSHCFARCIPVCTAN